MVGVSDSSGNSSGATASGNHEGDSGVVGSSIAVASDAGGGGGGGTGGGGGGGEDEKLRGEEGERNSAGNRWPRQETLALLKIRSEMDVAFRDSTLKGPLWEEISRKLAELGFHRSAKKCKEKFENVYKYHKRTKDGRAARPDAKSYRFFDQLQALDHHHQPPSLLPPPSPSKPIQSQSATAPLPMPITAIPSPAPVPAPMPISASPAPMLITVAGSATTPLAAMPITAAPAAVAAQPSPIVVSREIVPASIPRTSTTASTAADPMPNSSSPVTTSSSSEDELDGSHSRSRKRKKLTVFFEKLMNEVIEKQVMLQKNFLEAIEKRDRERLAREEAWKVQEMTRMNREHEMMLQERSIAAAKDAAVIAFLQKISEQAIPVQSSELLLQLYENQKQSLNLNPKPVPFPNSNSNPNPNPSPSPLQQQPARPAQPTSNQAQPSAERMLVEISRLPPADNAGVSFAATTSGGSGGGGGEGGSSSRWPKPEVQALIRLRTNMDVKYQENGPKGPLWEEISASMRKLGYNRSAKRCKEKWENINKYFKKVKESNKKRPEESKTCPYFHQLDALYKEKGQIQQHPQPKTDSSSSNAVLGVAMGMVMGPYGSVKPEDMIMPLRQAEPLQRPHSDVESETNMDPNREQEEGDEEDEDDDDDDDEEGGDYEVVANNNSSSMAVVE